MSILHGCVPPAVIDLFGSVHCPFPGAPLPSKQCEFGGRAIALELKLARAGITKAIMRLIKKDFNKMMMLLENLDRTGEGESVFCYLVIFNKLPQRLDETPLAKFVRENRSGPRHKILYKSSCPCPGPKFSARYSSRRSDLVFTSPPYGRSYMRSDMLE